jgi:hypothetical protein
VQKEGEGEGEREVCMYLLNTQVQGVIAEFDAVM